MARQARESGVSLPDDLMPKRSRIDVHALLIRSARPAAEKSGEGAALVTLWLGAGLGSVLVEWLDCRIGSEDPVSREAAVAAAATLGEKVCTSCAR